jgi:hypothetical protein
MDVDDGGGPSSLNFLGTVTAVNQPFKIGDRVMVKVLPKKGSRVLCERRGIVTATSATLGGGKLYRIKCPFNPRSHWQPTEESNVRACTATELLNFLMPDSSATDPTDSQLDTENNATDANIQALHMQTNVAMVPPSTGFINMSQLQKLEQANLIAAWDNQHSVFADMYRQPSKVAVVGGGNADPDYVASSSGSSGSSGDSDEDSGDEGTEKNSTSAKAILKRREKSAAKWTQFDCGGDCDCKANFSEPNIRERLEAYRKEFCGVSMSTRRLLVTGIMQSLWFVITTRILIAVIYVYSHIYIHIQL